MTKIRAFTLVEVLVAIGILALLAALLHPVFRSAQNRAQEARCINNFKQIYTALTLYRERFDGTDSPAPSAQMGLPPHLSIAFHDDGRSRLVPETLQCRGRKVVPNEVLVYVKMWPQDVGQKFHRDDRVNKWVSHVSRAGASTVLLADYHHETSAIVNEWSLHRVLGLRLDGSIKFKKGTGSFRHYEWWE